MRHLITVLCVVLPILASGGRALAEKKTYYPRFGTEIRLGPYRPVLDNRPEVNALRNLIWDKSDKSIIKKHPMMLGVEFDYYVLNEIGLLGPYAEVGYWTEQGHSRLCRNADGIIIECTPITVFTSEVGVDVAALSAVPLSLGLVYRYDMLRRNLNFPLVVNLKAGVDYILWWGGLGKHVATYRGKAAQGGALGFSASFGLAFALDQFTNKGADYGHDRDAQSSYVFVEYQWIKTPVQRDHLDFSDATHGVIGLAVDFH